MGAISMAFMDPQWLKLRWRITVLVLGAMTTTLLMHSSRHPMQVETSHSVQVQASNPQPIDIQVDEDKPVPVDIDPKAPLDVKIGL
jgi:hypothetical protein